MVGVLVLVRGQRRDGEGYEACRSFLTKADDFVKAAIFPSRPGTAASRGHGADDLSSGQGVAMVMASLDGIVRASFAAGTGISVYH